MLIIMLIYSTKNWLGDGLAVAGTVIWKDMFIPTPKAGLSVGYYKR